MLAWSNQLFVTNNNSVSVQAAIAAGAASTISWAAIRGITFTTNTVTATNSFDLKGNTGVTITPPSTGGGHIIGGGLRGELPIGDRRQIRCPRTRSAAWPMLRVRERRWP
jgi:hypothetical protein